MARGVFERPKESGIWWIRYADQYGKLHREKVGPKSLAISAYQKRKTEIKEGKFFPEKVGRKREVLFEDMVKVYLEDHAKPNKRSYKDDILRSKRLIAFFKGKSLSEISRQDVERLKARLANEVSPATVNRYLALLKTIFNKAVQWAKTKNNPTQGIKQFKENNQRTRFLNADEETKLKAVFPQEHWPLVELALHTGMRRVELFNLQWNDINFDVKVITVPKTKNGEIRYIPMNDKVVKILRDLPSRMKSEYLFPSSCRNAPISATCFIRRIFVPALKEAEINDFTWHDLRHTFASRLVMKGNDLKTVQELLGHANILMTMTFSHLSPKHKRDAVQKEEVSDIS